MNWYRKSNYKESPIEFSMDDYLGPPPETKDDEGWSRYNEKRRKWKVEIQRALSEGRINLDEANKRGFYSNEEVKALPVTLYHTTTSKDKVISDGLKTRDNLGMRSGVGLGGGSSDTISFTIDLDIALGIRISLLEAKRVFDGRLTMQDMINMAYNGEGADRPWLKETLSYWGYKGEEGEDFPIFVKDFLIGIERKYLSFANSDYIAKLISEGWKSIGSEGRGFYRKLTEKGRIDGAFSFYKIWSSFRQYAGGPEDPVFFLSDPLALKAIPEDQIAVLRFRSKPDALGYAVGGLEEWRIWSGNAVEFVDVVI